MESTQSAKYEFIGKRCVHRTTKQKGTVMAIGWTPNHVEVQFDALPSTKTVSVSDIMVAI